MGVKCDLSHAKGRTYILTYLLTYLFTYLLTYLLHGAGHYLKSSLSLSLSKKILLSYGTRRFITMFTRPYPEPDKSSLPHRSLFGFNFILSPMPRSSPWSLTFGPPNQNPVNTSPLPHACHMPRPSHLP
jgi:hypothetical protein